VWNWVATGVNVLTLQLDKLVEQLKSGRIYSRQRVHTKRHDATVESSRVASRRLVWTQLRGDASQLNSSDATRKYQSSYSLDEYILRKKRTEKVCSILRKRESERSENDEFDMGEEVTWRRRSDVIDWHVPQNRIWIIVRSVWNFKTRGERRVKKKGKKRLVKEEDRVERC